MAIIVSYWWKYREMGTIYQILAEQKYWEPMMNILLSVSAGPMFERGTLSLPATPKGNAKTA